MNKERYNQIIDEAYENYSKEYEKDNSLPSVETSSDRWISEDGDSYYYDIKENKI